MADEARPFPQGFRWGVAGAAHQVEGGNWNSNWWEFEHTEGSGCAEVSGDACDSFHRWPEDAQIAADLGFSDFRFSVEWSRIEPEDGEVSQAALEHYARVCEGLRHRGLTPVVTLHHFTHPRWFSCLGGWESDEAAERFERYCGLVVEALGRSVGRICTINEPNIVATMGYVLGLFPPGRVDLEAYERVTTHLVAAHRLGVDAARAQAPGVPVGLTLSMTDYQLAPGGEAKLAEALAGEDVYLDATAGDDFLGVQCYTRMVMGPSGWVGPQPGVPTLVMGYEYWPGALEACLRRAWGRTGGSVPLLVTENGIGTDDDAQRRAYVTEALAGLQRVLDDGIEVLGYTYWSLLDNFEWAMGYRPRFGLVEVDRRTFERRVKESGRWLGAIARANAFAS